ncbi:MAG: HIRAN domain-containing protein [Phycisphaerae bacterium]|nr:HIRAN domain-containing protein [Phycisphaerae bacterium]
MPERVSLTKAQRESGIGAELLVLCQSMTEDGTLSLDEIKELVRWLRDNREADLPAKDYLFETVSRIVADRKVTRDEQKELYRAIEIVLPPDARRVAAAHRKALEAEIKSREKLAKEGEKERKKQEYFRSRPVDDFDFMVAGVHYEGRGDIIRKSVREGDRAYLARDRENAFSPNAVEVRIENGEQIGFVPEDCDTAAVVAQWLELGSPQSASIKKILVGGRVPIPIVLAYFYRPDAQVDGIVLPDQVPPKPPPVIGE